MAFITVNGYRNVKIFLYHPDNRNHPLDFFFNSDLGMARTGGFSSYVNDCRSLFDHICHMFSGFIYVIPLSAVGKRIRGNI